MSELRWHPILEEWVITATHRQDRTFFPPPDYNPLAPTKPGGFPTEVPAADYDIVVFENKFPSLQKNPPAPAVQGTELTPVKPAVGVCEVVVYTPQADATLVPRAAFSASHPLPSLCAVSFLSPRRRLRRTTSWTSTAWRTR